LFSSNNYILLHVVQTVLNSVLVHNDTETPEDEFDQINN